MKAYIVDSFTNRSFKGNPAGVCLLEESIDISLMQNIAKELNLSETAFIKKASEDKVYSIRYFSPKTEIPLCGHATLAAAKILFEYKSLTDVIFITGQHLELNIRMTNNELEMEFPVYELEKAEIPSGMLTALGINEALNCEYNKENNMLLLEIENPEELKNMKPDFTALLHTSSSINGVVITSVSNNEEYDFFSRYFWPWSGSNEDPVTGATHTFLAKYWSQKLNKTVLKSFQASERTGYMEVEITTDNKVLIRSNTVIIFEGSLLV